MAFLNFVTGPLDRSLAPLKCVAGVYAPGLLQVVPTGLSRFRVAHWRLLLPGLLFSMLVGMDPHSGTSLALLVLQLRCRLEALLFSMSYAVGDSMVFRINGGSGPRIFKKP